MPSGCLAMQVLPPPNRAFRVAGKAALSSERAAGHSDGSRTSPSGKAKSGCP
jgi:hypothetical protein